MRETEAGIVGRSIERGAIADALLAAVRGAGRIVVVDGAAGLGKTALVDVAEGSAREAGFGIIRAQGAELLLDSPFEALRLSLRDRSLPPAPARTAVEALQAAPADLGHGNRLVDLLVDLVERVALQNGAAVLIDDAHWLDVASARVVLAVARLARSMPVLLVVATRGVERTARVAAPLVDGLVAAGAHHLRLAPLTAPEAAELVARHLGPDGLRRLEPALAVAGGSPLLLNQLVVEVARTGDLGPFEEADAGQGVELPATFRRIVERRLGELDERARELLATAALLGPSFAIDTVATATGRAPDQVALQLSAAAATGLIAVDEGQASFSHALVQRVVAEADPPAVRQARHRLLAAHLAQAGADPAQVAEQLARAEDGSRQAALAAARAMLQAADAALARSVEVCLSWLGRAEQRVGADRELRGELLWRRMRAEALAGRVVAAERIAQELVGILAGTEREVQVRYLLAGATALHGANRGAEAIGAMEAVLAFETLSAEQRAELVSGAALVALFAGRVDDAQRWSARARELPDLDSNPTAVSRTWEVEAIVAYLRGDGAAASAASQEAVLSFGRAARAGATQQLVFTVPHATRATLQLAASGPDAAIATAEDGLRFCEQTGLRVAQAQLSAVGALCHLLGGDVERAEAGIDAVVQWAVDTEMTVPMPLSMALRALLCAWRGDHDAARRHRLVAEAEFRACGPLLLRGDVVAWALAEVAVALEDPHHGVEVLRRTWQRLEGKVLPLVAADYVRLSVGPDPAFADAVVEAVGERAARSTVDNDALFARLARAVRRGDDEAMGAVARRLDAAGHRLAAVRYGLLLAAGAATSADEARAEQAMHAADRARAWGLTALAATAPGRIGRSGQPGRSQPGGAGGVDELVHRLSPTEQRVARFVADGLTNREIAERLHVSPRTVETHVTHVLRKLGVSSRVHVAALLGPSPLDHRP